LAVPKARPGVGHDCACGSGHLDNEGFPIGETVCNGGNSGPCEDGSWGTVYSFAATFENFGFKGVVAYELRKRVNRGGDNGATTPSFGVSTVGVARRAGVEVRSEVHAAHRDHGRGHGVTWDCKDGSGPATGGTVPPTGPGPVPGIGLIGNGTQCFTGTTIQAFSAGMTYDF